MKLINQINTQPVNIAILHRDEEYPAYPEGARDKTLVYTSSIPPFKFLKANHKYLFKRSSHRYIEQFWTEILAYQLGLQMDITVPPTFVAFDSESNQCGALIEWFINNKDESYIPGGDYCELYIPNFDRKKGTQHNFETVSKIFKDLTYKYIESFIDWKSFWSKTFVFDALIGNTDRHQDNWGIILKQEHNNIKNETVEISPVFDNGTSMGHEILAEDIHKFESDEVMEKYISRGKHHIKWCLTDDTKQGHFELLQKVAYKYPETLDVMKSCINKINENTFQIILEDLVKFDIPIRLSTERSKFMLKLLKFRHDKLKRILGC